MPAERGAVHDRDALRYVQRAHELGPGKTAAALTSSSMNMPASGTVRAQRADVADARRKALLPRRSRRACAPRSAGAMSSAVMAASWMNPGSPNSMHIARCSACMRQLARTDQPAGAPAGHGVRLGQAAEGHDALGSRAARLGTLPPGASPAYTSSTISHRSWRCARVRRYHRAPLRSAPRRSDCSDSPRAARAARRHARASAARSGRQPAPAGTRTRRAPETSRVAG